MLNVVKVWVISLKLYFNSLLFAVPWWDLVFSRFLQKINKQRDRREQKRRDRQVERERSRDNRRSAEDRPRSMASQRVQDDYGY